MITAMVAITIILFFFFIILRKVTKITTLEQINVDGTIGF